MEMSMIAEGYYATKSAYHINQAKETPALTPIIDTVYEILYRNKNAKNALKRLTEMLS
jgi:glycerol-3-phosphate dehydrogenase (NAD(P)+)